MYHIGVSGLETVSCAVRGTETSVIMALVVAFKAVITCSWEFLF